MGERQIHDNIVVAQEVLHYLKIKKGKKYDLALKVDMNKAYDRVEWGFLQAVLIQLGFHKTWVEWVMECVGSVSYFLTVNGKSSKSFSPSRGLRQGDPLSPYLFLLVLDVLSRLIHLGINSNVLCGIKMSKHCLIDLVNCINLFELIQVFCDASGQRLNMDKSSVIFSRNTPVELRKTIIEELKVKHN